MRLCPGIEGDNRGIFPQGRAFSEFVNRSAQRQIGAIDPAEFFGVGMDMDQQLAGVFEARNFVAIGGRLAQPRADCNDEIGVFDPLDQLGIGAIAEIAGIDRAMRSDGILPAEGGRHGKPDPFGKLLEILARFGVPARPPDDRDGARRVSDQIEHRLHCIGTSCLRRAGDEGPGLDCGRDVFDQHILG